MKKRNKKHNCNWLLLSLTVTIGALVMLQMVYLLNVL